MGMLLVIATSNVLALIAKSDSIKRMSTSRPAQYHLGERLSPSATSCLAWPNRLPPRNTGRNRCS
jgi:hypothetical protein